MLILPAFYVLGNSHAGRSLALQAASTVFKSVSVLAVGGGPLEASASASFSHPGTSSFTLSHCSLPLAGWGMRVRGSGHAQGGP